MTTLGPSPFAWLQFDKKGKLTEGAAAIAALSQALTDSGAKDLVVLSHGWQTDRPGAQALYKTLWANACTSLSARGVDPAKIVVAGVLWPAKAFNAEYDGGEALTSSAGGALAVGAGLDGDGDLADEAFEAVLAQVTKLATPKVAANLRDKARAASKGGGPAAALAFFEAARAALDVAPGGDDPELAEDAKLFTGAATAQQADDLLSAYSLPFTAPVAPGVGAASGLGGLIGGAVSGAKHGVAQALNLMSYYTMKGRAGDVGQALGADVLPKLAAAPGVRLHLAGHSFGGRLVTAAAAAFTDGNLKLTSLTLLQAAFSHYGLTADRGAFATVMGKVPGPIAITHTHNDWCCTLTYPAASFMVGDTTKAIGDKNDPYGAMGANGAQKLAAAQLAPDNATTTFQPVKGKVNRFLADAYVKKEGALLAHNNIANPTCGELLAAVITA